MLATDFAAGEGAIHFRLRPRLPAGYWNYSYMLEEDRSAETCLGQLIPFPCSKIAVLDYAVHRFSSPLHGPQSSCPTPTFRRVSCVEENLYRIGGSPNSQILTL